MGEKRMRLIDADAVIKAIDKHTFDTDDGLCLDDDITCILEEVPTIGERKSNKWIDFSTSIKGIPTEACGECGEWSLGMGKKYCPCCGSRNM